MLEGDILIYGGTVIQPTLNFCAPANVLVKDGKISAVLKNAEPAAGLNAMKISMKGSCKPRRCSASANKTRQLITLPLMKLSGKHTVRIFTRWISIIAASIWHSAGI